MSNPPLHSPENSDYSELACDYDWHLNISTDPSTLEFFRGLDVVKALRNRYHPHDVRVCPIVLDCDTLELTRVPGKMGIYVRKGAEETGRSA